jgi:hypothetical protein
MRISICPWGLPVIAIPSYDQEFSTWFVSHMGEQTESFAEDRSKRAIPLRNHRPEKNLFSEHELQRVARTHLTSSHFVLQSLMDFRSDDDWFSPDLLPSLEEDGDDSEPSSSTTADPADLHALALEPPSIPQQMETPSPTIHAPLSTSTPPNAPNSIGSDLEFERLSQDPNARFNPRELGFLPVPWPEGERTFGELLKQLFQRKSRSSARFLHKLYGALKISEVDPELYPFVGVRWATDKVIKVDKAKFGRLLAIKAFNGALFHRQGNFPTHGFVELGVEQARAVVPVEMLRDVDFDNVRLLRHRPGVFVRGRGPEVDETGPPPPGCEFESTRPAPHQLREKRSPRWEFEEGRPGEDFF